MDLSRKSSLSFTWGIYNTKEQLLPVVCIAEYYSEIIKLNSSLHITQEQGRNPTKLMSRLL